MSAELCQLCWEELLNEAEWLEAQHTSVDGYTSIPVGAVAARAKSLRALAETVRSGKIDGRPRAEWTRGA